MAITPYLGQMNVDPEKKRVMGVAFEMVCASLRLQPEDKLKAVVASKIIELAKAGKQNPDQLCERALNDLREQPAMPETSINAPPPPGRRPDGSFTDMLNFDPRP